MSGEVNCFCTLGATVITTIDFAAKGPPSVISKVRVRVLLVNTKILNLAFVDEMSVHPCFGYSLVKNALASKGSMLDDSSIRPAQLSPSPKIKDLSGDMRASLGNGI